MIRAAPRAPVLRPRLRARLRAALCALLLLGSAGSSALAQAPGDRGGRDPAPTDLRPDLERIERWLDSGDADRRAAARRELGDRIGVEAIGTLHAYLSRPLSDEARGPLLHRLHELSRARLREVESAIEAFESARRLAREIVEDLADDPEPDPDRLEEAEDSRRTRRQARERVEAGHRELRALGLALAPTLFHRLEAGGTSSPLVERFQRHLWHELEEEARRLYPHAPAEGAIGPHESRALVPLIATLAASDSEGWDHRRVAIAVDAIARIETLRPDQVDDGRALLLELGDAAEGPLAEWLPRSGPLPLDLRERVLEWQRLRVPPGFERRTALDLGRYGALPRVGRQEMIQRLEFVDREESAAVLYGILRAEEDVALKVEAAAVLSRLDDPRGADFLRDLGLEQAVELEAISRRVLLIEALQLRDSGDEEGALAALLDILRRFPGDFRLHYEIAYTALRLRRLELSILHFERALALESRDPIAHYNHACALALAGRSDAALDALAAAIAGGFKDAEHIREDPDLESLRGMPRFRELLEGIGE